MITITNAALIQGAPKSKSPSAACQMPVIRITSSAGDASLRVTSRESRCMNSSARGSPSRTASGNPTASANVAPSPTTAAVTWMKTRIEWKGIEASTRRRLRRRHDRPAQTCSGYRAGQFARVADDRVGARLAQFNVVDQCPCDADAGQAVRARADHIEGAVADHHRLDLAELAEGVD